MSTVDEMLQQLLASGEGHADPYPLYRSVRETAPVHRSDLDGIRYLSGYTDCQKVLVHPGAGRQPDGVPAQRAFFISEVASRRFNQRQRRTMLTANPPDHTRLRGLANRAFTARRVENLRERITHLVDAHLDAMLDAGEVDVMSALAFSLPVTVIGELVGVPEKDREWFRGILDDFLAAGQADADWIAIDKGEQADLAMETFFSDLAADKRAQPADDLLSGLVEARDGADRLSEQELLNTATLIFAAGFVTTTNLIGNGLLALLRNPDEMTRLWDEPGLATTTVDEILRYDSPVQINGRYIFEPITLSDGTTVESGESVITLIGGANRDPARYPDPERFDAGREDNHPLSFGWGIHHCLGAPLARLEGQIVFTRMAERLDAVELLDDDPPRQAGFFLRGLSEMPVRVKAR
ncbi:MAG: cytochrome P450 [Acidimicrobiia bacterium]